MAVATNQIDEVFAVILRFVPMVRTKELFAALRTTRAYQANQSFRDTVERLDMVRKAKVLQAAAQRG